MKTFDSLLSHLTRPALYAAGLLLIGWWLAAPRRPDEPVAAPLAVSPGLPVRAVAVDAVLPGETPVAHWLRVLLDTVRTAGRPRLQSAEAVRALYGPVPTPVWTRAGGAPAPAAGALLTLLEQAPAYGLQPAYYELPRLQALRDSLAGPADAQRPARQARFEVYLSDAALSLMRDLHRGRLRPATPSPAERASGTPFSPADTLRQALAAADVRAAVLGCQPRHREYRRLQAALARWLREPVSPDSAARWQARYEQVALNLERWRWQALPDSEYVLVNLPAFELLVVRADSVRQQHRVVVGKPQTPSPTLSSQILYFTLAPDWYVPRSIATKEILPRVQTDPGYLARNHYALYDRRGRLLDPWRVAWSRVTARNFAYIIRQTAGCDNALGNIVFRFPNPYAVYLHDTPARQLFEQPQRALSHGCMRVAEPMRLAAYLLRREDRPVQLPDEATCARDARARNVWLRRPMPLHVCYATCGVAQGRLRFYPDIYRRDAALRRALATAPPQP
ncbi:L,D-transpeptidase family protein [Hymenobacter edaphi]|uniref:L,D-transpeptidase family protein n=1 Tax=Hymenobacter edaphi TaxID=2211146 RepID=UPI001057BB0B|nr:L,D-transpeptidase family protein [Hymenobacter edaphi]